MIRKINVVDKYFINAIDCNFPYNNERLAIYLILHACKDLGDGEVLHIIYEILYPGKSIQINQKLSLNYIDSIDALWKSPDKKWIIELAKRKVTRNDFSEDEVLELLNRSTSHKLIEIIEGLYIEYSEKIEYLADKIRGTLKS